MMRSGEVANLAAVAALEGLGVKSVDRLYAFLSRQHRVGSRPKQPQLI
jgi:hypothetical protein